GKLVYSEGLLVGYRGYDRSGTDPLFGFGHGLGYTQWEYESIEAAATSIGSGDDLDLLVKLRNRGARAGREVVQVYLEGPDDDPSRPVRILAGFANVAAEPGAQVTARLSVPSRAFARYDEGLGRWDAEPGAYTIRAGRSSRDLRVSVEVVMR
ncbi:MAG: hypothetical protein E6I73_11115, partial [Chloroflexi bacterium]